MAARPGIQASMVELIRGPAMSEPTAALTAEVIAENARFHLWAAIAANSPTAFGETQSPPEPGDELEGRCREAVQDFKSDGDEARLRRTLAGLIRELNNIRMT
jgi:hypothetical protein